MNPFQKLLEYFAPSTKTISHTWLASAPPCLCTQGFNPALLFQEHPSPEHTNLLLQCLALQELPESCKQTGSGLNTSCSLAKASCTAEHLFLSLVPHTPAGFGVVSETAFMSSLRKQEKQFFHNGFTLSRTGPSMLRNQRRSSSSDLHSGGLKAACSFPKSLLGWGQCSGNKRADSEAKNGAYTCRAAWTGQSVLFSK